FSRPYRPPLLHSFPTRRSSDLGTGVLAILASLKKAKKVEAIDIDQWSYENTIENISLNTVKNISVFQGDAALLNNKHYDVILARSEEHTSELQSRFDLVCRLLL